MQLPGKRSLPRPCPRVSQQRPPLKSWNRCVAVRLSNLVGLGVLFIAGWMLSKYAGAKPWQGGLATAVTGAVLISAIIALGG